ncbi:unnamed protein product [Phytophthora fragariaefolia]|uniref:Unnamed protein product n=1 Tax=Phytophthora fragariaefolia TaxID=1490495 RepID=A0A9W6XT85_9STRA|nr:unnamed protein product [Phytophthora fragariaefolia]
MLKLSTTFVAAACAAIQARAGAAGGGTTCSSLNGPFCPGFGPQFAAAPPYARQNLDVDEEVRPWRDTGLGAATSPPFSRAIDSILLMWMWWLLVLYVEQELEAAETAKNLKIEKVLEGYELQAAASEANVLEEEEIILDIEMLLDDSMALLNELDENDDKSPMAGTFAFSSANGAFELLEKMDGDELKVGVRNYFGVDDMVQVVT